MTLSLMGAEQSMVNSTFLAAYKTVRGCPKNSLSQSEQPLVYTKLRTVDMM